MVNADYFCLHSIADKWVAKLLPKKQACPEKFWSHKEQQDQQIQNFFFLIPPLLIILQVHPALICASNFFVYLLFSQWFISVRLLVLKTVEKKKETKSNVFICHRGSWKSRKTNQMQFCIKGLQALSERLVYQPVRLKT